MSETPTLVKNAIHNPADARHFMRVAEPDYPVAATIASTEIARSRKARKVKEVGFDVYDPVIYFPREDVDMSVLQKNAKTTNCPLKGDTEYFDVVIGGERIENVAWSYATTIEPAAVLQGLVAFDVRLVQVTEHTTEA